MTIDEIIQQNEELQRQYAKAINTIASLERKVAKLQRENESLKEENKKLRKLNNTLVNAIKIAIQIHDREKQYLHLKAVLEKLRETGEFKG
ncbi:cell division protein ZapB [Saccharolobus islandicus]|uniref:cell division protein ZapB n=1 Tax=Saccharolobus islandicus TaxID=43080 RepID=UPI000366313B|nr:cell division protein ZapB [Sulfolobus islandicus]